MKTASYSRVAIEDCITAMLPKIAVRELDRAASEEGLYRSALVRAVIMRYLLEPTYVGVAVARWEAFTGEKADRRRCGERRAIGQATTGNGSTAYFAFHALNPPASATVL